MILRYLLLGSHSIYSIYMIPILHIVSRSYSLFIFRSTLRVLLSLYFIYYLTYDIIYVYVCSLSIFIYLSIYIIVHLKYNNHNFKIHFLCILLLVYLCRQYSSADKVTVSQQTIDTSLGLSS